jgi:hypothetical protein
MADKGSLTRRNLGLLSLAALIILSTALVAIASWLEGSGAWRHPLHWLGTLDQEAAAGLMSDSAQVVAGMLAILITVVAIG